LGDLSYKSNIVTTHERHKYMSSNSQMPYKLEQLSFFSVDNPLAQHGRNVESQNGEDGIIEYIFGVLPPKKRDIA
jgi:hypothetical protein